MATDTTYNVSLVTSGEIVASIKDADETLVYPKTVAQAVTVMQAGYSDGSTTQTLAERLAALDGTDSALSTSISTLEDSLLGQFDALEDINTALGTVTSQDEVSTSVVTAISEYTEDDTPYINVTTTPLLASPVTFDESMTFAEAVRTLAAYCHSHSVGDSTTSAVRSTCSYCSCDDKCRCDD